MNTYEINEFNEVVPYTNGRRCNDTRAWRDATELELQQQEEIEQFKREILELESQIELMQEELENYRD
jgi:molecular chaperone GrpE (heat shock protein)